MDTTITLIIKKAKGAPVGSSKIGGKPHVPKDFKWPLGKYAEDPLGFVCQINMAEVQKTAPSDLLPKKGLLQVFCTLEETELSSFGPSHKIIFYKDVAELVESEFPEGINVAEASLEERSITFGKKGKDGRMLGGAPEFNSEDLRGVFDGNKEELLLELPAYGNVTRKGDTHSIFGEGVFYLMISKHNLKQEKFDEIKFIFEGGS